MSDGAPWCTGDRHQPRQGDPATEIGPAPRLHSGLGQKVGPRLISNGPSREERPVEKARPQNSMTTTKSHNDASYGLDQPQRRLTTETKSATPFRRHHRHALRRLSHHRLHGRPWHRQVRQPRALRRLTPQHLFPRSGPLTRIRTREVPCLGPAAGAKPRH